jgi:CHAT domain-containing protein
VEFSIFAPRLQLWEMDHDYRFSCFYSYIFIIAVVLSATALDAFCSSVPEGSGPVFPYLYGKLHETENQEPLGEFNRSLLSSLQNNDLSSGERAVVKIETYLSENAVSDSSVYGDALYLSGVYYLMIGMYQKSLYYLDLARQIKENRGEFDVRYSKILYNLGVIYFQLGDYENDKKCSLASLELDKKFYGIDNPNLIQTYCNLLTACIGLKEYNKIVEYSNAALAIAENNKGKIDSRTLASIYNNMSVSFIHLADYTKARVYLEKTESLYASKSLIIDDNTLALLNNMAIVYGFLCLTNKSEQYYKKGISYAEKLNSPLVYNYIGNYALFLAHNGRKEEGERILNNVLIRATKKFGIESPAYLTVVSKYADYLRDVMTDNRKALEYYEQCRQFFLRHNSNHLITDPVYIGYAQAFGETGEIEKALEILQTILFPDSKAGDWEMRKPYPNPSPEILPSDKSSLVTLQVKYSLLWKSYRNSGNMELLISAVSTCELLISVLEKVRLNISEEDSRLILGDRFRTVYIDAIRDLNLLYNQTGKTEYLIAAFKYAEKSKVAGLLASAREMNASQFNIPSGLADLEKRIRHDLNNFNASIEDEIRKPHPDTLVINTLKDKVLERTMSRDSLVSVFENKYPGYYSFKYNTSVSSLADLPSIIGRDVNYLNYIAADTVLYIFSANRKGTHLVTVPVDSSFFDDIRKFRKLLGMPSPVSDAREDFKNYLETGYRLFKKIMEPVIPYLISNKILISPDNILSYIPFETIPASVEEISGFSYSKVPYLMNTYDISYTYSVTFMAESMKRKSRLSNKLVAFAPEYESPIDISTVLLSRQTVEGLLPDLPFAKHEAEYVAKITGGKLFEGIDAREVVFKEVAGDYDIIHLAMHTILNDNDPMYSTLIFSAGRDSLEDRYLRTYEVYSVPLRAKMVVLSSCNSGAGYLYSGEGILSLARGFLYSGSSSVVMAMWEIEDRSGTEIVKSFYYNLKQGYSKSAALRKARMSYLENADQQRAHPYFWSSLVIYGNNSSLYFSPGLKISAAVIIFLISAAAGFYFWRRKYS